MTKPIRMEHDGDVWYRCPECNDDNVDENGYSIYGYDCEYCPQHCSTCGRGFCDQSC